MASDAIYLVIGLGSMGQRRIRCLRSLGRRKIYGYDLRSERVSKVVNEHQVEAVSDLEAFFLNNKNIKTYVFICVSPDAHQCYMEMSLKYKSNFFVEASVLDHGHDLIINLLRENGGEVKGVPSCTLLFHPAIQEIKKIIQTNILGKISTIVYHSGQYLPDWHPYEPVDKYYVSKKDTGAAREIVPFELTWLSHIFGVPTVLSGLAAKTIAIMGASEIDDTYVGVLQFDKILCSLVVDVVSRYATRRLLINGDKSQLRWEWVNDYIEVYDPDDSSWRKVSYSKNKSAKGYNENIPEQMYCDEVQAFLDYVDHGETYPTDFTSDKNLLRTLLDFESNGSVNLL